MALLHPAYSEGLFSTVGIVYALQPPQEQMALIRGPPVTMTVNVQLQDKNKLRGSGK